MREFLLPVVLIFASAPCPGQHVQLFVCILSVLPIRKQNLRGWTYTTGRAEAEISACLTFCPSGEAVLPTAAVVLSKDEGDVHG